MGLMSHSTLLHFHPVGCTHNPANPTTGPSPNTPRAVQKQRGALSGPTGLDPLGPPTALAVATGNPLWQVP